MTRWQIRLVMVYCQLAAVTVKSRRYRTGETCVGAWGHFEWWCRNKWDRGPLELTREQARHAARQLNAWRAADEGRTRPDHSVDANKMVKAA